MALSMIGREQQNALLIVSRLCHWNAQVTCLKRYSNEINATCSHEALGLYEELGPNKEVSPIEEQDWY